MAFFQKLNVFTERIEKFIIAYSILVMAGVSIVNVIARNFLHRSFSWVEEVTQFSVVLVTFVGTSYAARTGTHIRMSVLSDFAGRKGRKVLAVLVSLGTALFMSYVTFYSALYVHGLYTMNKYTLGLQIPIYVIMIWVPIGFAMTAAQYFGTLYLNLTRPEVYISPAKPDAVGSEDDWVVREV